MQPATEHHNANADSRQVIRNAVVNYLGLGFGIVTGFVLTPILLRHFGPTNYGLWVLLTSVVGYAGLLDAGVGTAVIQHASQAYARDDQRALAEIYATATAFYCVSGALLVGLCGLFVPYLGAALHIAHASDSAARIVVVTLGISSAVSFAGNVPTAALVGGGRSDRLGLASMPLSLASRLAQIAVVLSGGGLVALAVTSLVTGLIGIVVTLLVARHTFPGFTMRLNVASRAMAGALLRSGRRNTMVSIAGVVSYGLDQVVIAAVLPLARLAPYAVALRAVNVVRNISAAGTGALVPTYGHAEAMDDKDRQFRMLAAAVFLSMAVMLPTEIAMVGFGRPLLRLWLGDVPPQTFRVLVALAIVFALQLPGHQCVGLLTGSGHNRLIARIGLPMALVNLAISIGATFWLGPIGPAIGSLPQVAIFDAALLPWLVCRQLEVPLRRYLRQALLPLVPTCAVAVAATMILRHYVSAASGAVAAGESAGVVFLAWAATLPGAIRLQPNLARIVRRRARA